MGAGILPVTILKGTIFFLLGKEQSNNYWCDFGGSHHIDESIYQTAIREGYEELDGFFGNENELNKLVKDNLVSVCYTNTYSTFLFYVKPQLLCSMPYYFNNNRKFLEHKNMIDYEKNSILKNGLFEKKEIKLFTKKDFLTNYQDIRPFYRVIVHQLLDIDKESFDKYI